MIKKDFNVGTGAELDVHVQSGRVEVTTGAPGFISVEVETRDPNFVVEKRGDLIYVSPEKNTGWLSGGSRAYVSAVVPEGTDVNIGTASGRIECRGQLGRVEVKSASGDVDIESGRSVVIKTASGDAHLANSDGEVRGSSASGDFYIGRTAGNTSISSASGDVRLEDAKGSVTISTASGNMRINSFEGNRAAFKSMSGNAVIGIQAGTKVDLDVSLLSGKLKLPAVSSSPSPSSDRQMSVKAKLVSGDFSVKRL